jgi:hypothetical protein
MLKTMVDAAAVKRARIIANRARIHVEVDAPGRSITVETGKGSVRALAPPGQKSLAGRRSSPFNNQGRCNSNNNRGQSRPQLTRESQPCEK